MGGQRDKDKDRKKAKSAVLTFNLSTGDTDSWVSVSLKPVCLQSETLPNKQTNKNQKEEL